MTEKTTLPAVSAEFKDSSGRWGGESKRDAVLPEYDRFGEPVDRVSRRTSDPKLEDPYKYRF